MTPAQRERLDAVLASPDDDEARLAFADSLGDTPRARFIRAQVRLGQRLDPARRKLHLVEEHDLLPRLRAELSARVVAVLRGQPDALVVDGPALSGLGDAAWTFRRGFIDTLSCEATAAFLDGAHLLFNEEPISQLTLRGVGPRQLRQLLAAGLLRGLTALNLRGTLGDEVVERLAADPQVARLRSLNLSGCALTARSAAAIARSPHLAGLRRLSLNNNDLRDEGAIALAEAERSWEVLHLGANEIGDAGLRALVASAARAPGTAGLRQLNLRANPLSAGALRALLPPTLWPRVYVLELNDIPLTDELRAALVGRWGRRVHLDPDWSKPRERGVEEVELRADDAIAFSGTRRLLLDWGAALLDAAGADLFTMARFARPEGAPCARCRTPYDAPAVASDGDYVEGCLTCKGGGVTLGPARAWDDVDAPLTRLFELIAGGPPLDPEASAAAADGITELAPRLAPRWAELTAWLVEGLRAAWARRQPVVLKRRSA